MQILGMDTEKTEEIAGGEIVCDQCGKRPAEIFQVTGDYCVECWQAITHTST
ncbi:hypothetical protein NTE_01854 [Candidatus Nitrososphaera evergladensis SR1]|uniref:Uncharacterized protein n=1 Tax=Candidatus Nitrososphaera evergladensis SR1 TaxID=1459636 RepID=A0A075MX86_9ARCH|nr:hypothetical protein NTE_01854 [Candidatus Nitrososphaera evergladensis SR1]